MLDFYKKNRLLFIKTYFTGFILSTFFTPLMAYAQRRYTQDIFGLFEYLKDIVDDLVIWLITTGAVAWFIWELVKMIWIGKSDSKKILYGLVALTVMFTFYAISGILAVTFGIRLAIPQFFQNQDMLTPGSGNVNNPYTIIGR